MPDMATVGTAVSEVCKDLAGRRGKLTARDISLVVSDMTRNPSEWGGWSGPNWDKETLTAEICQRLWNTPVHPSEIFRGWLGLPFKALRQLTTYGITPEQLSSFTLLGDEAAEWLCACACNRRARASDWKGWIENPLRWRFRHLSDAGFARIQEWEKEAA